MIVEALLIGLLIGILRNGRLDNLADTQFRGVLLVILSFLLQLTPSIITRFGIAGDWLKYFPFAGVVLIAIVVVLNLNKQGAWIILIGVLLNMAAMAINGFLMPVDFASLDMAGLGELAATIKDGAVINYISSDQAVTWSNLIGKFIPVPKPYPFPKILSPGDIIISLGILFMIQGEMNRAMFKRRGTMVQFTYRSR